MICHRIVLIAGVSVFAWFGVPSLVSAATVMDFPDNTTLKGGVVLADYNFRSAPPVARQCAGQGGSGSFTVTKPVDQLSPQLAEASKAKKGSLVQIDDNKADGTHVAYQLTDATISGIKPTGSGDKAMESISFNYSKIRWITVSPCKAPPPRRDNNAAVPSSSYGGTSRY
jgi:hypothetical protein